MALTSLLLVLIACTIGLGSREATAAQLTASWVDNSNGTAATRIERRLGSETLYAAIAHVPPGTTTYVDASVEPGTTYCYRALAYGAEGVSSYSNEACATSRPDLYTVTVSKTGDGTGAVTSTPAGIDCGTACSAASAAYPIGTSVVLAARPAAGSVFRGWSGGVCAGKAPCAFAGNASFTATAGFGLARRDPPKPPAPATVGFESLPDGSVVQDSVTVAVSASGAFENLGVALDGVPVVTTAAGWVTIFWNTTATPNGSHSWTATAYDAAGNAQATSTVTTLVSNPAPGLPLQPWAPSPTEPSDWTAVVGETTTPEPPSPPPSNPYGPQIAWVNDATGERLVGWTEEVPWPGEPWRPMTEVELQQYRIEQSPGPPLN